MIRPENNRTNSDILWRMFLVFYGCPYSSLPRQSLDRKERTGYRCTDVCTTDSAQDVPSTFYSSQRKWCGSRPNKDIANGFSVCFDWVAKGKCVAQKKVTQYRKSPPDANEMSLDPI